MLEESTIPVNNIESINIIDLHYIGTPTTRYNLLTNKKNYSDNQLPKEFFNLKATLYKDHVPVYTDGSRMNEKTSYAVVMEDVVEANRLPSTCSVYTAELYAIYRAINLIYISNHEKAVIFSDSLSAIKAIDSYKCKSYYMIKLQKLLSQCNKEIAIEWVPSHVGIPGNDQADSAAKEAIENDDALNIKLHYYDIKCKIKNFIRQRWQSYWTSTNCPLQRLKPILGDWKWSYKDRCEQIIISRIRCGLCLFMIKHHIDANTQPDYCLSCRTRNNLYHLFFRCPLLTNHRVGILTHLNSKNLSYSINNLLDENFPTSLLFKFPKDAGYYTKI